MRINPVRVWRYNGLRRKFLGKVGILEEFSVVRVGPTGMENRVPYVVGLVRVGKEKVMAQIVDVDESRVVVGMKMVGRLRRLFDVDPEAVIVYGLKFAPSGE